MTPPKPALTPAPARPLDPTPAALLARLRDAWRRSDALFATVRRDTWLERPIALRHPVLFYVGHLPAFAWNQIARGVLGEPPLHERFDELFERGIDPATEAEVEAERRDAWPAIDEVLAYRDAVRERLPACIDALAQRAGRSDDPLCERLRVVQLVIEHELMHHETLLYMIAQHPLAQLVAPLGPPVEVAGVAPAPRRVHVPSGPATLGVDLDAVPFAWDNELTRTVVDVEPFDLDATPVTLADYRRFVDAGGYDARELWTDDDWAWRQRQGVTHPAQWRPLRGLWVVRAAYAEYPLEAVEAWPAQVSHAEASAYARWRGARLPTEAELQRAAYGTPDGADRPYPWGDAPPTAERGTFDFVRLTPRPVGATPSGRSAWGVDELVGNGWEWTSTPFRPLPGFEAWARTYPGYSSDFFDDDHYVVFGASWATDRTLLRASLRNWFQPRYPYVFSAFRLAWPPA